MHQRFWYELRLTNPFEYNSSGLGVFKWKRSCNSSAVETICRVGKMIRRISLTEGVKCNCVILVVSPHIPCDAIKFDCTFTIAVGDGNTRMCGQVHLIRLKSGLIHIVVFPYCCAFNTVNYSFKLVFPKTDSSHISD